MPRATFAQIVNRSMSEVITRSLVTSLSTLLPIAALMFFGGATLRDFGFALLIGVASGTYSSIFIAAPVLTHWKERETVWRRRERIVLDDHDGVIPAYAETSLGEETQRARRTKPVPAAVAEQSNGGAEAGEAQVPVPTPAATAVTAPQPRTPEARRAARRAARAASTPATPQPEPDGTDDESKAEAEAKRAAANRRRKKHGRSR
jgi:SecD/SecF fusion protein